MDILCARIRIQLPDSSNLRWFVSHSLVLPELGGLRAVNCFVLGEIDVPSLFEVQEILDHQGIRFSNSSL